MSILLKKSAACKYWWFVPGRSFIWSLVLSFSLLVVGTEAQTQGQVYVSGVSTIQMKRTCKNDNPRDPKDYERALRDAKVNALQAWAATKSAAVANLFADANNVLSAQLDEYLLNPYIKTQCSEKTFQVSVRAELNSSALNRVMSQSNAASGPRSRMTAVFIARKQTSIKTFDDKVTRINETQEFSEAEQSADVAGSGISASGFSSNRNVETSGGSTERKADKVEWDVFQADGLDAAVNEIFTSFGFRLIDASQVASRFTGFDTEAFKRDFGVGDDLSVATKQAAFEAISGKIPLFAICTLDVMSSDTDPVSGLVRVFVSVKGQVFQDDGMFYETVASVAPTQIAGLGPSDSVAETNALIEAAKAASQEIVNQLNAAGVQ